MDSRPGLVTLAYFIARLILNVASKVMIKISSSDSVSRDATALSKLKMFSAIVHEKKQKKTKQNKDIFQKLIINYSGSDNRRVELDFASPNTTDLAFAESIIRKAVDQIDGSSEVEFYYMYMAIDDPKIKLIVSFRIDNAEPKGLMTHRHNGIMAVHKAFAEHQIVKIAVPEKHPAN